MSQKEKSNIDALFAEVVRALASLIEEKDPFLRGHAERVATRSVAFARHLQLNATETKNIYLAGLLHDVGMVCVPSELLHKPAAIDENERLAMEQHPVIAERILSPLSLLQGCLPAIRHHHEAYDGSGYPDGLQQEEIPVAARLLSIVDGFEAMIAPRPHRTALAAGEALGEIVTATGRRHDPEMVKQFVAFMAVTEKVQPVAATAVRPEPEAPAEAEPTAAEETPDDKRLGSRDLVMELVQRLKDGVPDLPVLPAVAEATLKQFASPSASTERLARVVEKDAVLSIGVLTASNSAWHGGIDKIASVRKAVSRLGFQETRKAVASAANLHVFRSPNRRFVALMERLWLHSLACAYAARKISRAAKIGDANDIFLMGLLHDVGKLPLLKILCRMDDRGGRNLNIDEALSSIQDVHGSFGGAILKRWGFGREFQRVATLHDKQTFTDMTDRPVLVVHLANRIAMEIGFGLAETETAEDRPADSEAAAMIHLGADDAERIAKETAKQMEANADIFQPRTEGK